MELSVNFSLVGSMFWAYFIGLAFTFGVATAGIIVAFFISKTQPKKEKQPTGDAS